MFSLAETIGWIWLGSYLKNHFNGVSVLHRRQKQGILSCGPKILSPCCVVSPTCHFGQHLQALFHRLGGIGQMPA